jgi:hypothetical protein
MKQLTIKIIVFIVFTLPALAGYAGDRTTESLGLYRQESYSTVQESGKRAGLYNNRDYNNNVKNFKEEKQEEDDSDSLRAAGTEGGGNASKVVPVEENWLILILGAILYASFLLFSLFLTPEKKKFLIRQ